MNVPVIQKEMAGRPYQLQLADYVTKRNGIIYLPTGAGKTFVAILVLKRLAYTLKENIANGGKRAIFMCNTVELSRQQAIEIKKATALNVGLYNSSLKALSWTRQKWDEEIIEKQVLVGTAQIFLEIISQNILKITDLSLVVIDECHHATGNHPIHEFLSLFRLADQNQLPRVVGLTGVLIKTNTLDNVEKILRNLESTLRGNIITVRSTEEMENVMVYSTKPSERLISFSSKIHTFNVEDKVKRKVEDCKLVVDNFDLKSKNMRRIGGRNKQNAIKKVLNDFVFQLDEFGLYAGAIAIMTPINEFEIKKKQAATMRLRDLYRIVIHHCERIRHLLVKEMINFIVLEEHESGKKVGKINDKDVHRMDILFNFSTPKLQALFNYMECCFKGKSKENIACLVFVQRRYTAKCLYHVILHYVNLSPTLKDIIRPQFMVGRKTIIDSIEHILESKWNRTALEEFRSGVCNVMFCSNVLEEGIDVQACNYVFNFDPINTFNSYIQTKGRARSQESMYCIFTPEEDEDKTIGKIRNYNVVHEKIRKFLMSRILERDDPNELEIAEQFVDLIPPFIISNGAKLLATSALYLLQRYCQSLPWDAFGVCQPWYSMLPANNQGKVACTLQLPMQSTVHEIIMSDYMCSNKEAKISAAFKACKRLYENGELNQYFLPMSKRERIVEVKDSLFKHWKKYNDDVCKKLAAKQLRHIYDRKCPDELFECMPCVGAASYAYAIEFATEFSQVNDNNQHIYKYLNSKATYAIMLNQKLPKLAEMTLFISEGKLSVKISEHPIQCVLRNEQELLLLKNFHAMIFKDILGMWKEFLVMDHRNKEYSFLLVPLNRQHTIDWHIVRQFQSLKPIRQPSEEERSRVLYRPEDYLNKVIGKWYTPDESENFVVTEICQDLCPSSCFPSNSYATYSDFFVSRYNVEVCNKTQFLLKVKPLIQSHDFFNNTSNTPTEKKKKCTSSILIPEMCHNYQYPGDLWLKALFIPSILNCVYRVLHAENLRKRINAFLGLDKYFTYYTPCPLILDTSLKRMLDYNGNSNIDPSEKYASEYTTKKHNEHYNVRGAYTQPIDRNRKLVKSFPFEDQYFVNSKNNHVDWSQFDVYQPQQDEQTACNNKMVSEAMKPLSIKDSSFEEKTNIEILKRGMVQDHHLRSAEQYEFLAALTTAGVNDVFDMERYVVLGDAFLKFSISLYLVNKYPTWNVGFLSPIKGCLVSNRNLLYCLRETDISKRICSTSFKPNTTWLPPLCSLPGNLLDLLLNDVPAANTLTPSDFYNLNLTDEEIRKGLCSSEKLEPFIQKCGKSKELSDGGVTLNLDNEMNMYLYKDVICDKDVADTLESILGVCVKNYGIHRTFRMLEFFKICPTGQDRPLCNLLDLKLNSQQLRTHITSREVNAFIPNVHLLERNICYTFKDRAFLLQALTHPSYPTNRITGCYQELKFIGEAFLDMLITCYIFERFQHMELGKIDDLRSALVNNITLSCICVRRRVHLFLLYENPALSESIRIFADFQDTQDHRVTDQVRILMEESSVEMGKTFRFEHSCEVEKGDGEDVDNENEDENNDCKATWSKNENVSFNMAQKVDVPKALGDVIEAIIGAIYFDCRDLQKTWEVIYKLFEYELNEFPRNIPMDPVSRLDEVKHANAKYSKPKVDGGVFMVKCIFNCLDYKCYTTHGFGSNAVQAKTAAAKQALHILAKHANKT